MVVGDVDKFLNTAVEHLDDLLKRRTRSPLHLSDSVLDNWTNPSYLRMLGQLYMRRAERDANGHALEYLRKAYAALQAAKTLERSWLASESTLSSYLRARAIYLAAMLTQSTDPFPADREGKSSLLALAEARANYVVSESIGMFRDHARALQSEISRFRKSL